MGQWTLLTEATYYLHNVALPISYDFGPTHCYKTRRQYSPYNHKLLQIWKLCAFEIYTYPNRKVITYVVDGRGSDIRENLPR